MTVAAETFGRWLWQQLQLLQRQQRCSQKEAVECAGNRRQQNAEERLADGCATAGDAERRGRTSRSIVVAA